MTGKGAASCYSSGHGETCKVGIPIMLHGPEVKITDDMIPDVTKQPDAMQAAADAGRLLGERLRNGHDWEKVALMMQQKMMVMLEASV